MRNRAIDFLRRQGPVTRGGKVRDPKLTLDAPAPGAPDAAPLVETVRDATADPGAALEVEEIRGAISILPEREGLLS